MVPREIRDPELVLIMSDTRDRSAPEIAPLWNVMAALASGRRALALRVKTGSFFHKAFVLLADARIYRAVGL
eukprot:8108135-Lingulodinium_polyedra.AAC.1